MRPLVAGYPLQFTMQRYDDPIWEDTELAPDQQPVAGGSQPSGLMASSIKLGNRRTAHHAQ